MATKVATTNDNQRNGDAAEVICNKQSTYAQVVLKSPKCENTGEVADPRDSCVNDSGLSPQQGTKANGVCMPNGLASDGSVNSEHSEKTVVKEFVDTPPPKVNPWTANKNAARVISGKHCENVTNSEPKQEEALHSQACDVNSSQSKRPTPPSREKRKPRKSIELDDVNDWPLLGPPAPAATKKQESNSKSTVNEAPPPTQSHRRRLFRSHSVINEAEVSSKETQVTSSKSTGSEVSATADPKAGRKKGNKTKWQSYALDVSLTQERRKPGKGPNERSPRFRRELEEPRRDRGPDRPEVNSKNEVPGAGAEPKKEETFPDRREGNVRGSRNGRGRGRGRGCYNSSRNRENNVEKFGPTYYQQYGFQTPQVPMTPYQQVATPQNGTYYYSQYYVREPEVLMNRIRTQVIYYFSEENLKKDLYLRRHMDANGYVDLKLVANFRRMKKLTDILNHIIYALKDCEAVELDVPNLKVRTRNNPQDWPVSNGFATTSTLDPDVPNFVPGQPYVSKRSKVSDISIRKLYYYDESLGLLTVFYCHAMSANPVYKHNYIPGDYVADLWECCTYDDLSAVTTVCCYFPQIQGPVYVYQYMIEFEGPRIYYAGQPAYVYANYSDAGAEADPSVTSGHLAYVGMTALQHHFNQ